MNKLSVVLVSYNQAQFLEAALFSVLSQDYKNIELVVIDGESDDGSQEILLKYKERITKLIIEKDYGQTDALIKGFSHCTGDVFFWLCSGDMMAPGAAQRVMSEFNSDPSLEFIYGDTAYLYPNGKLSLKKRVKYNFYISLYCYGIISQPSWYFSARRYKELGGLDASLNYAMDYDLWLRFGYRPRYKQLRELLSFYRLHKVSKTVSKPDNFKHEYDIIRHKLGFKNKSINRILFKILLPVVVLKYFCERGQIILGYDKNKYL